MVFGFSVFGSSGAKEDKGRLDDIQSIINEHKDDAGDVNLDLFAQCAKDLKTALHIEIARGAKNGKVLVRIEQLSDGILSNIESRITREILETPAGPGLAAKCADIAKDLDCVRASKASVIVLARTEDLQEELSQELLIKVKDAYAEIPKDPPNVLQNVRNVMDAVESAQAKAPTSTKVSEKLISYCVQLARVLLNLLIQALQADPHNAGLAKRIAERLDGIAEKLVAVLGSTWDPKTAPQIEEKVDESAKKVFIHNTNLMLEEAAKGASMTSDGAMGIMQVLKELQPWWIIAADVEGCAEALQAACDAVGKALLEVFKISSSSDKEQMLGFAGELDTVVAKFDGIEAADNSVRAQMRELACSDLPAKFDALDTELAKEELEIATVNMALKTMEAAVPMWAAATAGDDELPNRLKAILEILESKIVTSVSSCPKAKAMALWHSCAKYEQLCVDLALGDHTLETTLAPLVGKCCLSDLEEEISKAEGMNPSSVLKTLEVFKAEKLMSAVADEETKARFLSVLRATEDRVIDGFRKSVAEENADRIQSQKKFASMFDELCKQVEPDIPDSRHTLEQRLHLLLYTGAAEKQVNSGSEMDCSKVNRAFDGITSLCQPPQTAPEEIVTRMQALSLQLRSALFARTLRAGEERMVHILECATKSESAMALLEQREAVPESSSELCKALSNTKDVNACLAKLDEELGKETGMNPNVVLKALTGLRQTWGSVATVGDFELRLVSVCALLEDRMLEACGTALAEGNFAKTEKLLNFGSRIDEVRQEAHGEATLCMQLASKVVEFQLSCAEKELGKETGMHPKIVLDSIGQLPDLLPRLQTLGRSESIVFTNEVVRTESAPTLGDVSDAYRDRLLVIRTTLATRMDKALENAMAADQPRKIEALIKFADEYDSVFTDIGIAEQGSLAERLQKKADGSAPSGGQETTGGGQSSSAAPDDTGASPSNDMGADAVGSALAAARAKLDCMKKSDLQKMARSMGISEEDRDAALDTDDPKKALIDLIFELQKAGIEADEAQRLEALGAEKAKRDQLEAMKKSDLQKLARSLGVSEEDRDEALDTDDPKTALIELILPLQGLAEQERAEDDGAEALEAEKAKRDELEAEKAKRDQLEAMKQSDLQKLARSLGVSEEDRDAALDTDDPKTALIELILPVQGLPEQERAQAGSPNGDAAAED